jgi:hypothetical protein
MRSQNRFKSIDSLRSEGIVLRAFGEKKPEKNYVLFQPLIMGAVVRTWEIRISQLSDELIHPRLFPRVEVHRDAGNITLTRGLSDIQANAVSSLIIESIHTIRSLQRRREFAQCNVSRSCLWSKAHVVRKLVKGLVEVVFKVQRCEQDDLLSMRPPLLERLMSITRLGEKFRSAS